MSHTSRIISLNIGMPQALINPFNGEPYTSSIARRPVQEPAQLTPDGFVGDSCSYRGHGGPYMKVNLFHQKEYALLEARAERPLPVPAFGENLTLDGPALSDADAVVGDILEAGTTRLQVSQPRVPCANIVRLHGLPHFLRWMAEELACGYYCRVLQPGHIAPGDMLRRVQEAPDRRWTIRRLHEAMMQELENDVLAEELEALEPLSPDWKRSLRDRRARQLRKN